MRRQLIALAAWAALAFPVAGLADDVGVDESAVEVAADEDEEAAEDPDDEVALAEDEEEEEEEPTAWDEYRDSFVERVLTGMNGLLTAPADPPMATIDPPGALSKAGYVRRPLGLMSGVLLMGYRAFMGVVDFGLAFVPEMPVLSPVPRYKLIPGFEHEDE